MTDALVVRKRVHRKTNRHRSTVLELRANAFGHAVARHASGEGRSLQKVHQLRKQCLASAHERNPQKISDGLFLANFKSTPHILARKALSVMVFSDLSILLTGQQ
ncbi:MAG: hypothetical protein PHV02_08420 [Rhodocyclaceae bacterium]|nr:hypothetical protein [Rhodocyclaceae bacterium]